MDCFLAVDGTLKIEPTVKSSSNDSIQEELPKLPKEPNSSTVLNRDTHPERVLRLSVDHIRKTFRFFKIKNFSRTFFRNFNFQIFFLEILKIETWKGWAKKFPILHQSKIQVNTGSLLIRVLSYNMNRRDLSNVKLLFYHFFGDLSFSNTFVHVCY